MKNYIVKCDKGKLTFKESRRLQATIERTKNGEYRCECAFHHGQCIGATYSEKNVAISKTLEYLESLSFDGVATYNGGRNVDFICNLLA